MPSIHLLIKGRVQGVFYRASAKKISTELKLSGWIRNIKGGDVEVMVTGEKSQLHEFTLWCRQGPADAIVNEVIVTETEETVFENFTIR